MAKYKIIPSSRTIVQSPISIGHKAEKGVEAIEFDLTAWVETYGSGTLTVIMRRWGDAIPYPIALEIDENNKATWTLSDIDTAKAGMAYAQLSYIVGETVVKKSDIYTFRVMDSLTGEGEPPEAYESWLEQLTHLAAEAMAEVLDIEGIVTDKTLSVDGGIADAKATGDALALKANQSTTYTKTEVDALIESVDVETDTTLSVSGKPADAKKTGDEISAIKADLGAVSGATPLEMSAGYLTVNTGVGTVVDTDNPTASVNYQYSVTPCVEGDEFLVSGTGGNAPRLWCFLDSTKAIIGVSEASLTAENLIITAPENTAYCIVNSVDKTKTSYKGVLLSLKVDKISDDVSGVQSDLSALTDVSVDIELEWTNKKRIDANGGVHDAGSALYMSQKIYVGIAKQAVFTGLSYHADIDQVSIACYASNNTLVQSYRQNNAYTLDIPENTAYIRLCHYDISYRPLANCTMTLVYFPIIGEIEDDIVEIGTRIDGLPLISLDRNKQKLNLLENLDPADVVQARFITNGNIGDSANANWTSIKTYIPVVGGTTYGIVRSYIPGLIWVNCKIAWYTENKTYISEILQTNNLGYTAPANAAFCRISMISKTYNATSGTDDFSEIFMSDYTSGLYVRTINPQYVVQNGYPLTTLFGKKWALFGDSITEARLRASICYHDYIRAECGIDTTNFAVGGAGYKCSDDLNVAIYQRVYQQRETLANYNVITIMAGVNDCTYFGNNMGAIDDVFVGDDYTVETENGVFACVNKTLDLIAEYAPLVRVGVILPLPAVVNNYAYNPADDTNRMSVFVGNMKTLLEKRGIPYLDLYHKSGLRPWDNEVNAQFFRCNSDDSPDRLHPNQYGHKFFYPMVREFVKSLI